MSRDHNLRTNHTINICNKPFESVEEFKYFGTTLTNQNSIHKDIKSRLKLRNHSVQNILSSSLYKDYIYRVIHKSLRDFRNRLRNNQERHGRKDHINR